MAIFINRDYLTRNTTNGNRVYIPSYITAIFLRRVLGYSHVGNTNFNINTVGTLLIATGDSTPAATPTFAGGTKAGINFGSGAFFEVSIPIGVRTVSAGDIGRILVLKSDRHPRHNSGCFVITGINAGSNRYVIDYRTNAENPPAEPADSIQWYLYESDINCPTSGAVNSGSGYRGNGNSTTPRVILQSPHATGWQVRICNETSTDIQQTAIPRLTMAPGFNGDSAGDFVVGGDNLHTALFLDSNANTAHTMGGGDNATGTFTNQYRITIIGDDTGQAVTVFARRTLDATSPNSWVVSFGIPDNEPTPLPVNNISRLFVLGSTDSFGSSGAALNDISFSTGTGSGFCQGISYGMINRRPVSCAPSRWAFLFGNNQAAGPTFNAQAGDCPFTSATELLQIDLMTGIFSSWRPATTDIILPFEPRAIGTIPFLREGRANFGNFTTTTDNASWNVQAATNASPIQITTTAANTLVTGQMVTISGVGGNTAANGTWTVTVINGTQFTLNGSTGNGAFTSGGTVVRGASWMHTRRGIYMMWNGPAVIA